MSFHFVRIEDLNFKIAISLKMHCAFSALSRATFFHSHSRSWTHPRTRPSQLNRQVNTEFFVLINFLSRSSMLPNPTEIKRRNLHDSGRRTKTSGEDWRNWNRAWLSQKRKLKSSEFQQSLNQEFVGAVQTKVLHFGRDHLDWRTPILKQVKCKTEWLN